MLKAQTWAEVSPSPCAPSPAIAWKWSLSSVEVVGCEAAVGSQEEMSELWLQGMCVGERQRKNELPFSFIS